MALPDLSSLCVHPAPAPGDLCVMFPGGARLCAQPGGSVPDPLDLSRQVLGQANAALAPLVPLFDVLDVVLAVVDCLKAIPAALGPPPDPAKLTDSIGAVTQKAGKLAALVPQLSVPAMVAGLLDALIAYLDGLARQVAAIAAAQVRAAEAAMRAAESGNVQLQAAVDCGRETLSTQLISLLAGVAPVNRLIALISVFAGMAGLASIPELQELGTDAETALSRLTTITDQLVALRAAIPV